MMAYLPAIAIILWLLDEGSNIKEGLLVGAGGFPLTLAPCHTLSAALTALGSSGLIFPGFSG
jgi:hypothetical protein